MMVTVRSKDGERRVKDILDLNLDMSVKEAGNGRYVIRLNKYYYYDGEYDSREEAEDEMIWLAGRRNALEDELWNF